MEPLLVFPDPPPPALAQALTDAGYPYRPATTSDEATRLEPEDGWAGALICADEPREDLFDDFCLFPLQPGELEARLKHLFWRTGRGTRPELIEYGPLVLNLETYQAAIDGRPLDLTYMEYELLRFLATHPGKVFTREMLLSRVWGYEYYGGARTVDVHIRRLRAKLSEEHAALIQTVRSVGYRFGQSRWGL
jgi:two-component system alkaline phosphatase synthesis response regulator PhoP